MTRPEGSADSAYVRSRSAGTEAAGAYSPDINGAKRLPLCESVAVTEWRTESRVSLTAPDCEDCAAVRNG